MSRFVIGLKAVAIIAAWVIVIWWFSVAPPDELSIAETVTNITLAIIDGCLFTAVIVLLNRHNIGRVAKIGFFMTLCSFLSAQVGGMFILEATYGYNHGLGLAQTEKSMFVAAVIGAIVGFALSELDAVLRFGHKQHLKNRESDKTST